MMIKKVLFPLCTLAVLATVEAEEKNEETNQIIQQTLAFHP